MLLQLRDACVSFSGPALLDKAQLQIDKGDKICLVGRNGAGKSTLLKVLAGRQGLDSGELQLREGVVVSELQQEVPASARGTIFDVVASGLGEAGELLSEFHEVTLNLENDPDGRWLKRMEALQPQMETLGGWDKQQQIEKTISQLSLDADARFSDLSGGMKRRVLLGKALVCDPDLLLLDEPTNHLDIKAIQWLETFLKDYNGTVLFITHDRSFLRNVATRIVELDRGQLTSWPGDYDNYLRRKQERLDAEAKQNAEFDKKLAQEEAWIRQGIKARRTRNEGRVRNLMALREQHKARREQQGKARFQIQQEEKSGKLVIEAEDISYGFEDQDIVKDFSTLILRGDKIGIIGPNGCGKSTLLKLLLGELPPQSGSIRHGTNLQIAYFDQLRNQLEEDRSVRDNVGQGSDQVSINGNKRHVMSYLQDFLFTPDRANSPVRSLSGGERNRVLLARLFTQPANLLVMDEPTNDLDIETLELLEELLADYSGTLLLVSHDRAFLNNVVTSTLVFEGNARVNEYIGGYDDWLRQRAVPEAPQATTTKTKTAGNSNKAAKSKKSNKLSYKDQRELEQLPQQIEQLEEELEAVTAKMSEPEFFKSDQDTVQSTTSRHAELEQQLEQAYERWDELESMKDTLEQ